MWLLLLCLAVTRGLSIEVQVDGVGEFFDSIRALSDVIRNSSLVPNSAQLVADVEQFISSPNLDLFSNDTLSLLQEFTSSEWQGQVRKDIGAVVGLVQHVDTALTNNSALVKRIAVISSNILEAAYDSPVVPEILTSTAGILGDLSKVLSQEDTTNITMWIIPVLENTANFTAALASEEAQSFFRRLAYRSEQLLMVLLVFFGFLMVGLFMITILIITYLIKLLSADLPMREGYKGVM
jgi:hypothetical protein